MRFDPPIWVQWSTDTPADAERVFASKFASLPSAPEPTGGELVTDERRYIRAICCQGVTFTGDHYAVVPGDGFVDVYCWVDDLGDWAAGWFGADRWRFYPIDQRGQHVWNTRQEKMLFHGQDRGQDYLSRHGLPQETSLREYAQFRPPPAAWVRHGIWLPNRKLADHDTLWRATPHTWRDDIPDIPVIAGGTETFLLNTDLGQTHDCTPGSNYNREMRPFGQSEQTLVSDVLSSPGDSIEWAFTTPILPKTPNVTNWPPASVGDPYFCSFDVTESDADLQYGLLTLGSSNGEFVRANSSCARQEGVVQEEGQFTGTGVKDATHTTWDPTAGADTDVFQVRIAFSRDSGSHGNPRATITTNSSSDAGGPWGTFKIRDVIGRGIIPFRRTQP